MRSITTAFTGALASGTLLLVGRSGEPTTAPPLDRPGAPGRATLAVFVGVVSAMVAGCSPGAVEGDETRPGVEYEFTGATPSGTVLPPDQRAPAPSFEGELLDETRFSSTSLEGDIVVLNFWGSWCAPCRVETPEFQSVYADVAEDGVQFLGVDVKDQRQLAVAFVESVGATYPSLFDPRGEIALAFRGFPANVVPSTILLDRAGRVAAVYTGAVDGEDLRRALTTLLEEAP